MNNSALNDYIKCIHNSKGRIRFRLTMAGIKNMKHVSDEQSEEVLNKIKNITGITKVRTNPIIASITILYNPRITTDATIISALNAIVKEPFAKVISN